MTQTRPLARCGQERRWRRHSVSMLWWILSSLESRPVETGLRLTRGFSTLRNRVWHVGQSARSSARRVRFEIACARCFHPTATVWRVPSACNAARTGLPRVIELALAPSSAAYPSEAVLNRESTPISRPRRAVANIAQDRPRLRPVHRWRRGTHSSLTSGNRLRNRQRCKSLRAFGGTGNSRSVSIAAMPGQSRVFTWHGPTWAKPNANDVPCPETCGASGAVVAGGLRYCDAAMFVAAPFAFEFMRASRFPPQQHNSSRESNPACRAASRTEHATLRNRDMLDRVKTQPFVHLTYVADEGRHQQG